MNPRRWLLIAAIAVAALQIGFLVSMIAGRAAILRDGREVLLEVRPVDPRDLLRGDYVTLGYNISPVPLALFEGDPGADEVEAGEVVYVRLKPDDAGIWQAVAARYGAKPAAAPSGGEIDIRGIAQTGWYEGVTEIAVDYGIERFYVPEGEGRAIETDLRERRFQMKVVVAGDGSAQIKSFHDGDTMLYAEPLY